MSTYDICECGMGVKIGSNSNTHEEVRTYFCPQCGETVRDIEEIKNDEGDGDE